MGLAYLPGALPCFEDFGNLPTDIVREDGIVQGEKASEALDMLIVPGGSLIESQSVKEGVALEILRMAEAGKFVLGICSGLQVLSKATDIGRLSAMPILRQGLGLLDVEFKPLICTDRVSATIVGESFMTNAVGAEVKGFHCHTYGRMVIHEKAKPILVSHVQRVNYHNAPQDIVSGVANKQGNVVGVLLHGLLDENPLIIQSIMNSLGISAEELEEIRRANSKLKAKMNNEIGISTNIRSTKHTMMSPRKPVFVLIAATGSGSGKTFIVSGIAGVLKKIGVNVAVLKVGGDIRDLVPALYLIKKPMKAYSSIKIGESGWQPLQEVIKAVSREYDFILIEGAMNTFTGLLHVNTTRPSSTAEVALALGVPTVIVVSCDKEGIEGAVINSLSYVQLMKQLGIKVKGVILNKARVSYLTKETEALIKRAFSKAGVNLLGIIPRIELEGRGMIPEVEIRYEDFGSKALEAIEQHVDLKKLVTIAAPIEQGEVDFKIFLEKFKTLLTSFGAKPQEEANREP
ncbi:MAG: AAA family ATPase [Candidatus Bathyarchaeota archaeon]|nr:AAA family ATPase [Candidatus Bathyarchaeota archaeon]